MRGEVWRLTRIGGELGELGLEGLRLRGSVGDGFEGADGGTTVVVELIAAIALFIGILDAITATRERTVGTTTGIGVGGVLETVITLFSCIQGIVAAEGKDEAAMPGTEEGGWKRGFALFIERMFDDAVAAEATFEETTVGTAVAGDLIAVITFLSGIEDAVAAEGGRRGGGVHVGVRGRGVGEGRAGGREGAVREERRRAG